MKTLLFVDHDKRVCRIYINCATKKHAKSLGLNVKGDLYKFSSKEDAESEAELWQGFNRNYVKL